MADESHPNPEPTTTGGEPALEVRPLEAAASWSPFQWFGDVLARIGMYLGQDAMPRMAAALAYRTVFSLIPLLLCGFLVLRQFQKPTVAGDPEGARNSLVYRLLQNVLDQSGLSAISSGDQSVKQWIEELVIKFEGYNFGAIGVVSALVLIYAALSLLVDIESSFNHIYGASRGRSWGRRVMQYWLMVSFGPLLLVLGFSVGESLRSSASTMLANAGGAQIGAFLVTIASYAVTVAISALLLTVLYFTIPNTSVRLNAAAAGGLLSAVLLEAAKYGFQTFFKAKGYESLYGVLALLPLFLLWVYITWFIVLFGLRVAFLVQHGRSGVLLNAFRVSASNRLGGSWMEPARCVCVVADVADLFAQGRTANVTRLAELGGMDEPTTRVLLRRLEEAGILHKVATEGREQTFALARPAEAVNVADIVAVGQSLAGPISPGPAGELLARVRNAQLQAVAGVPLSSVLTRRGSRAAPSRPAGHEAVPNGRPAPAPTPT